MNLKPQPLVVRWVDEENALRIFSDNGQTQVKFSDIHSIHFSNNNEFNICDKKHYQYKIENGVIPDLNGHNSVSIKLVHVGEVLPSITVKLMIYSGNVLNLKWTYTEGVGKKMFKVPDEYINANNLMLQGDLS